MFTALCGNRHLSEGKGVRQCIRIQGIPYEYPEKPEQSGRMACMTRRHKAVVHVRRMYESQLRSYASGIKMLKIMIMFSSSE